MELAILSIIGLWIAYVMDCLLGDPEKWPHPVIYFGNAISKAEKRFNKGRYKILKGGIIVLIFCTICYSFFYIIGKEAFRINQYLYLAYFVTFTFFGLANTTLIREGKAIFNTLQNNGLEAGQKQLSRIVGRDTTQLNENQIRTAALESMAENLSDGVVAPLFYLAAAGIPGMMTYKLINTFDSMIGYKNERYLQFGKIAARLDDVANFIPARITALLMILVSGKLSVFQVVARFGRAHKSPNSGYPESAMAGILDCRFGGPNIYHGILVDKPYIGTNARDIIHQDVSIAARINQHVCFTCIILISLILCF